MSEFKLHTIKSESEKGAEIGITTSEDSGYKAMAEGFVLVDSKGKTKPLANFTAKIVAEETIDNGLSQEKTFVVSGELGGEPLHEVTVPSAEFPSLRWINGAWGSDPVIFAGHGTRDHLRAAIQLRSEGKVRRTKYAHLGWVLHNNELLFLSSAGAIGRDGFVHHVNVDVSNSNLSDYKLDEIVPNEKIRDLFFRARTCLELAPKTITYPLWASVFRAPLCHFHPVSCALWIAGRTGTFKSEMAAIFQSFYGAGFHGKNHPENFSSTVAAIMAKSALAKDVIFSIDDFAPPPGGSQSEINELNKKAEELIRALGNQGGRSRAHSNGLKLRPTPFPRGFLLMTGEDYPHSHSIQARLLRVENVVGSTRLDRLDLCQDNAKRGDHARLMASYIQWCARNPSRVNELGLRQNELRSLVVANGCHPRVPDNVAQLLGGLDLFCDFMLDVGAFTDSESKEFWLEGYESHLICALNQVEFQKSGDPAVLFGELIGSALRMGLGHVASAESGGRPQVMPERWGWVPTKPVLKFGAPVAEPEEWLPNDRRIGWLNELDNQLYLDMNAAHAAVIAVSRKLNKGFSINRDTLIRRLADKGLIVPSVGERRPDPKRCVCIDPITKQKEPVRVVILRTPEFVFDTELADFGARALTSPSSPTPTSPYDSDAVPEDVPY